MEQKQQHERERSRNGLKEDEKKKGYGLEEVIGENKEEEEEEEGEKEEKEEQGRIHGQYQLRTGGQGRKCAHFSTRVHGRTVGQTDGQRLL